MTLVLALLARVAPSRVARLMVLAWLLTLIPPLADLVLHHKSEAPTIGYMVAEPVDLPRIITINKPMLRVDYELQEIGRPDLAELVRRKLSL